MSWYLWTIDDLYWAASGGPASYDTLLSASLGYGSQSAVARSRALVAGAAIDPGVSLAIASGVAVDLSAALDLVASLDVSTVASYAFALSAELGVTPLLAPLAGRVVATLAPLDLRPALPVVYFDAGAPVADRRFGAPQLLNVNRMMNR